MNSLPEQESYWDKVAEQKEFPVPFHVDVFEKYVSRAMKILDFGCGYGRVLDELHKRNFENLVGVDFSQRMVNRGLRQHPYLNLLKCGDGVIPFPDSSFHAVILIVVMTCIPDTQKQCNLMTEIRRILKDGGILYVHDCLLNQDKRNIERYEKYKAKYREYGVFELPEGAVFRHHTNEHIIDIMKDFDQIVFEQSTHTTMNGNTTNGFCYIGSKKAVK